MLILLMALSLAPANLPDRHFYDAQQAVDNAVTCVEARSGEATGLTSKLRDLEALGRRKGLQSEIDRQKRELHMFYMSSLRIPCGGGKAKAFHDAHLALSKLEQFLRRKRR